MFMVPLNTCLQSLPKESERARVIASGNIWNSLFMVAGSLLCSLSMVSGSLASATCPGEVFINLLVVPEYTTWMPSAATNAMWNHDTNWLRSSPDEICSANYDRYSGERTAAYLPMKFTKVTIPTLTDRIYPNLGEISYRANGIANGYGNIAYDMITKWTDNTADHSDAGDGTYRMLLRFLASSAGT